MSNRVLSIRSLLIAGLLVSCISFSSRDAAIAAVTIDAGINDNIPSSGSASAYNIHNANGTNIQLDVMSTGTVWQPSGHINGMQVKAKGKSTGLTSSSSGALQSSGRQGAFAAAGGSNNNSFAFDSFLSNPSGMVVSGGSTFSKVEQTDSFRVVGSVGGFTSVDFTVSLDGSLSLLGNAADSSANVIFGAYHGSTWTHHFGTVLGADSSTTNSILHYSPGPSTGAFSASGWQNSFTLDATAPAGVTKYDQLYTATAFGAFTVPNNTVFDVTNFLQVGAGSGDVNTTAIADYFSTASFAYATTTPGSSLVAIPEPNAMLAFFASVIVGLTRRKTHRTN